MPSFDTLKDTIYDMVNGQSGLECQWDFQDGAIPDKPFFSLSLPSFRKIGRDMLIGPDSNGNFKMNGNRDFTLSILGFGANTIEKSYILQSKFERPDIHALFVVGGIVLYDIDQPILDISGLDQSEPEERSSWDIFMRTDNLIENIPVGLIEKMNIAAKYTQPGKPDIEHTINIDSTT